MALVELLGSKVKGKDDKEVDVASIAESKEVVGLYFSAHWCPPCRGFTPVLKETYDKMVASGKPFEIIFLSSDRDEGSFNDYYDSMSWLALPFSEADTKGKLSQKYSVSGIPTLILLDAKTGEVISDQGRTIIQNDPEGAKFPWR